MKKQFYVAEDEEWMKAEVDPRAAALGVTRNSFYAVVMRLWVNQGSAVVFSGVGGGKSAAVAPPPANGVPVAPKRGPGRPPKVRVIDPELLKPVTYHITDPFLQKAAADPRVLQKLGFLPEHLDAKGIPKNWTIDREFDFAPLNTGSGGGYVHEGEDFEQPPD